MATRSLSSMIWYAFDWHSHAYAHIVQISVGLAKAESEFDRAFRQLLLIWSHHSDVTGRKQLCTMHHIIHIFSDHDTSLDQDLERQSASAIRQLASVLRGVWQDVAHLDHYPPTEALSAGSKHY